MVLPEIRLQSQRHKRVAFGHPWVFSNEIVMDDAAKALPAGSIVLFKAHDRTSLGVGSFNPHTLIAGRIFSREPLASIDKEFFLSRFRAAQEMRSKIVPEPYYRLVHAEADGLPGLIIDRFNDCFSVQLNTAGMDRLWPTIQEALVELFSPRSIFLHNDSFIRELEGLPKTTSIALGKAEGLIEVHENGLTYFADISEGQKTGWYFDQRDNHALMARFAKGANFLDLYCHGGGFGLLAAKNGAKRVVGVDSSQLALDMATKAASYNKLDKACSWVRADVFEELEKRGASKERFDIVIADPPPFVRSRKDIASGARGYRKLARLSVQVLAKGGLLYIASCSHNMDLTLFTEEVAKGLNEIGREGRILYTVFAAPDHPVHPNLPESAYLKGLVLQVN